MRRRGRGQQRIDDWQNVTRIESPPDLRNSFIDRQYPLAERLEDLFEPVFESRGPSRIS
jgi:hypothetical protein